jgi:hypothetical protein
VDVALGVDAAGRLRWAQPVVQAAWKRTDGGVTEQLAALLAVRRHLGWEVNLVFEPGAETAIGRLMTAWSGLEGLRPELSGPGEVAVPTGGTNAPARVHLAGVTRAPVESASVVVRAGEAWTLRPAGLGAGVARVVAPSEAPWGAVREAMRALLLPGARIELLAHVGNGA